MSRLRVRTPRIAPVAAPSGITGSASSSIDLTSIAVGAVLVQGTASSSLPLTSSATGTVLVQGTAFSDLPIIGIATGSAIVGIVGNAVGDISVTGNANAVVHVQGSASNNISLNCNSTAVVQVKGNASGSITITGNSAGSAITGGFTGIASGDIQISGSATATALIRGAAFGDILLSSILSGSVLVRGTAVGNISITCNASTGIPASVYVSAIDLEFIKMAEQMFEEFVPQPNANYKYINADNAANSSTPWDVTFGSSLDYPVKLIVYPSEIEGRRFSKYREGTEVPTGAIKVLMKKENFEPKQKDFIELRGKLYKVTTIDPIAPLYQSICYILTLGV